MKANLLYKWIPKRLAPEICRGCNVYKH